MRLDSARDISAALGAGAKQGGLVLLESDIGTDFFDLRTGLAGELFQKFVNYRVPLAIVVADAAVHGERFEELAREHRTHPMVRILASAVDAATWIEKSKGTR
jgi:hypothetical protein